MRDSLNNKIGVAHHAFNSLRGEEGIQIPKLIKLIAIVTFSFVAPVLPLPVNLRIELPPLLYSSSFALTVDTVWESATLARVAHVDA